MIKHTPHPHGGHVCQCDKCGARAHVAHPQLFARSHSCGVPHPKEASPQAYHGLGDVIAKATAAVGIKPCPPCKKRQQQLNGRFPRIWKK